MNLFTANDIERLYFNGLPSETNKDHFPVVRLYRPYSEEVWLFTKLNPNNAMIFWGLVQDRYKVTAGYTNFRELIPRKNSYEDPVVRDPNFSANYPLSVYASAAREIGRITETEEVLKRHRRIIRQHGFTP